MTLCGGFELFQLKVISDIGILLPFFQDTITDKKFYSPWTSVLIGFDLTPFINLKQFPPNSNKRVNFLLCESRSRGFIS